MQRQLRQQAATAGRRTSGWVIGSAIGTTVVAAVVALVSAILAYARAIDAEAPKITSALTDAEHNTAPLRALRTTIDHENMIVEGLQRARARLGG